MWAPSSYRLAVEVLLGGWPYPGKVPPGSDTQDALHALFRLDRLLGEQETAVLKENGFAAHYLIIRPISPVSPPDPATMARITAAIRTLLDLGMICGRNEAD